MFFLILIYFANIAFPQTVNKWITHIFNTSNGILKTELTKSQSKLYTHFRFMRHGELNTTIEEGFPMQLSYVGSRITFRK